MARREIAPEVFLAGVPLFKELDTATLGRLAASTTRRTLKRGETLFHKGDTATGMYVVVYGEVKLVSSTPARGARLSGIVGAGQSFGEPVMFLERPALVEAQAASDALLLHLPREVVFGEIERSSQQAHRESGA
jgi:CRP-like cAMP-binding protein